jgi:hypothetical protein
VKKLIIFAIVAGYAMLHPFPAVAGQRTLSESIAAVNKKHPYCIPEVIELATAQRMLNEDIAQYPGKDSTEKRLVYIFGCKRK